MASLEGAVLPKGSLILVTGANGYVASHVVDQFLRLGYKVRGTVRDSKKNAWVEKYFHDKYGTESFELAEVKDLADPEALKKALEGENEPLASPARHGSPPHAPLQNTVVISWVTNLYMMARLFRFCRRGLRRQLRVRPQRRGHPGRGPRPRLPGGGRRDAEREAPRAHVVELGGALRRVPGALRPAPGPVQRERGRRGVGPAPVRPGPHHVRLRREQGAAGAGGLEVRRGAEAALCGQHGAPGLCERQDPQRRGAGLSVFDIRAQGHLARQLGFCLDIASAV